MSKLPKQTKLPAISVNAPSSLLDYLPAIYRERFLGQYLSAFEKILLGRNDEAPTATTHLNGLEETIDAIALYFDPSQTPKEFLSWLAGWAALSLRADLDEDKQRSFIAQIIQLYRRRGTKDNLIKLLTIFTGIQPTVEENATTCVGDAPDGSAYCFNVSIMMASPQPDEVNRQRAIARSLIEMEKPAHTNYHLDMKVAGLQLGDYAHRDQPDKPGHHATIGKDTFIGIIPDSIK